MAEAMRARAGGNRPLPLATTLRRALPRIGVYALLAVFAVIYLLPMLIILMNTLRPLPEIVRTGFIAWPQDMSLQYWGQAWSSFCIGGTCEGVSRFFVNSLAIALPANGDLHGAGGAERLHPVEMPLPRGGRDVRPRHAGCLSARADDLAALGLCVGGIGLSNTLAGLILIHTVQGISFTTLFCRNYFLNVPDDLMKAARIDGAGFWRIFRRIILPLSPPIVIVAVIWQFTGIWNEFLFGAVFTSGDRQPITAAIVAFSGSGTGERHYNVEAAAVIMAALPPLFIYLVGGRYFVRGLTSGAIK